MNIATRYYSRSGNTQKLAEAVGKATNGSAKSIDTPLEEPVDILFLGGAIYAGNIDKQLRTFAESLSKDQVGQVVVFSTAAGPNSIVGKLEEILQPKGIVVSGKFFQCRGRFLLAQRNRPNAQDLADVAAFAEGFVK